MKDEERTLMQLHQLAEYPQILRLSREDLLIHIRNEREERQKPIAIKAKLIHVKTRKTKPSRPSIKIKEGIVLTKEQQALVDLYT